MSNQTVEYRYVVLRHSIEEDVEPLNKMLAEGWTPVREMSANVAGTGQGFCYPPTILVLLSRPKQVSQES